MVWDGKDVEVRDFDSGQVYTDSTYREISQRVTHHLTLKWWNENYMAGFAEMLNAYAIQTKIIK